MTRKIIAVLMVCVTLMMSVSVTAFAAKTVGEVKSFTQTAATSSSVTLSWKKVSGAKAYRVYVYDKKTKSYVKKGDFTDLSATFDSLEAGKTHKFRIRAYIKSNGKKVFCDKFTYVSAVTAPPTVGNFKVSQRTKNSFVLSWDAATAADGYIIQRLDTETSTWKKYKTTSATSYKVKKEGYYRVISYRNYGNKKYSSAPTTKLKCKFDFSNSKSGTFTFTVYGYGHGVGMSQAGALAYAESGKTYEQILKHYYKGTQIEKDDAMPEKVTYRGEEYSLKQYLYRVVQAEIGNPGNAEMLKTQVVVCYSYAKYKGFKLTASDHAFSSKEGVCDEVKKAVKEVIGEYVSYDGKVCLTPYFALSAGKTASCESTWGSALEYLTPATSSSDKNDPNWKTTYTISSEDFKQRFFEDYGIELKGDPSKWIKIISHDNAVSAYIGYVSQVSVGGKVFRGSAFKSSVMHHALRSHCFTVSYKAD